MCHLGGPQGCPQVVSVHLLRVRALRPHCSWPSSTQDHAVLAVPVRAGPWLVAGDAWGRLCCVPRAGGTAGPAQAPTGWVLVHLPMAFQIVEQGAESQSGRLSTSQQRGERGRVPSAEFACWPMDGWSQGSPGSACLPDRPCCRGAAQPVPASVLQTLPIFGALLNTAMVAVRSLCASPWFPPPPCLSMR